MKDALKKLGICLWVMLHDFLTSKKVLTAILTSVAGIVIKDPATREHVLAVGITLIGGQAIQDFGKAKAAAPPATVAVVAAPPK
jgi:hypothetical protein